MVKHERKREQTFPVEDGSGPAPREERIAGIVQRVWADSTLYHEDVEPLLREWLHREGYEVGPEEFGALLAKAQGQFAQLATTEGGDGRPWCDPRDLVARVYIDVERMERTQFENNDKDGRQE